MSRIGKKPVEVPKGVTVQIQGQTVSVKGPQGELSMQVPSRICAAVKDGRVIVEAQDDTQESRSLHGLCRSLIANMVHGVAQGYSKELEIQGVGFRASLQGGKLLLSLGFPSPIEYVPPAGIKLTVKENTITVSGPDSKIVGDAAAVIRSFYPPEPYKGKGIRYRGEYVRRKAGKTVA